MRQLFQNSYLPFINKWSTTILRAALLLTLTIITTGCNNAEPVATVSQESEAIEIINLLNQRGLAAQKQEVGEEGLKQWRITVTQGMFNRGNLSLAFQIMHENGLPRPKDKGMEGAYEENGMFPSESAQHTQRLKELKTEIERQLRLLPDVTRVSVNVVLPEDDTINFNPYPSTASVLIIHRAETPSFPDSYVQSLVAKAVPKLQPENVGVVLVREVPQRFQSQQLEPQQRLKTITYFGVALIAALSLVLAVLLAKARNHRRSLILQNDTRVLASATPVPTLAEDNGNSSTAST
jgi:type III secretion system YscJ/HrcJ family lipoprotein